MLKSLKHIAEVIVTRGKEQLSQKNKPIYQDCLKMSNSNNSFSNVLVIVFLGAFLATSATIADTWQNIKTTKIKPLTAALVYKMPR